MLKKTANKIISWEDIIYDGILFSGLTFFVTLFSLGVTNLMNEPEKGILSASISAGITFIVVLLSKRSPFTLTHDHDKNQAEITSEIVPKDEQPNGKTKNMAILRARVRITIMCLAFLFYLIIALMYIEHVSDLISYLVAIITGFGGLFSLYRWLTGKKVNDT